LFLKRARELGYERIATGHYAQLAYDEIANRYSILESADAGKDQSYVLFPVEQSVLAQLELPMGGFLKEEVRRMAREIGLPVADKPDSQEICFIPSNNYGAFLEREAKMPGKEGLIQDRYGNVLGRHRGCHHYTIGQRKGLQIPFKHALYVVDLVPECNLVIAGSKEDVLGRMFEAEKVNWFFPASGEIHFRAQVKIRSRHKKAWAQVERLSESGVRVCFDEPQEAITPGQGCVFYDGPRVLGGGWISKRIQDCVAGESSLAGTSEKLSLSK
jgi:tRNA-uridine 2-sulfurtransferase